MKLGARGTALIIVLLAGAGQARAEVIAEIGPAISVGYTDNATPSTDEGLPQQGDEFSTFIGTARGRYIGRKQEQSLSYRLSYTKYFHKRSSDTVSQEVGYFSSYNLTPVLDLSLGALGTRTKTSAYILRDQSMTIDQATGGAYMDYLSILISQGLVYRPTPRRRYIEGLSVSRLHYLAVSSQEMGVGPRTPPPDTTYVNGHLRGEWERARDVLSLDGQLSDAYSDNPRTRDTIGPHRLMAQGLAGYRRELNVTWSFDVALGGVLVLTTQLAGVAAPAGFVNVGYRREWWFASASVSQTAAPNIYLGNATINDQAVVRAALPLTRSQQFVLSGNVAYTYARFASQSRREKAYDLFATGASVSWHAQRLPIWTSLDYNYTNQHGSTTFQSGTIPDRERQVIMLSVGGSFAFGKGTPPIVAGSL